MTVEHVHVASVTLLGHGDPVPQGSKRIGRAGKFGRPMLLDANAKTKPWRSALAAEALAHFKTPELGVVALYCDFNFTRPKSHYNKHGALKPSAPMFKKSKPDLDKLLRSVCDALTGIAWRDDSQVVTALPRKLYSDRPGVTLTVYRVEVA